MDSNIISRFRGRWAGKLILGEQPLAGILEDIQKKKKEKRQYGAKKK